MLYFSLKNLKRNGSWKAAKPETFNSSCEQCNYFSSHKIQERQIVTVTYTHEHTRMYTHIYDLTYSIFWWLYNEFISITWHKTPKTSPGPGGGWWNTSSGAARVLSQVQAEKNHSYAHSFGVLNSHTHQVCSNFYTVLRHMFSRNAL